MKCSSPIPPPPAHCVAAVVTRSRAFFPRDLSLDDLVSSRLGSAGGGKGARGLKITIAGARGRGRGRGGAGPVRGTSSAREARLVDRSAGVLSRRGAAGGQVKRVRCRDASVGGGGGFAAPVSRPQRWVAHAPCSWWLSALSFCLDQGGRNGGERPVAVVEPLNPDLPWVHDKYRLGARSGTFFFTLSHRLSHTPPPPLNSSAAWLLTAPSLLSLSSFWSDAGGAGQQAATAEPQARAPLYLGESF